MKSATLMYVIQNKDERKSIRLETESLYSVDMYTSQFKNQEDFIKNYPNKEKIYTFQKQNGIADGKIVVAYAKSTKEKENLKPLFDNKEDFVFKDDPYEGRITEIEKSRKLLFNSKNQLFARLILKNNTLGQELNKSINLTNEENEYITKYGFKTINVNNTHYITFKSLLEYRIKEEKLGYIRNAYQEMLNVLKSRMMFLDENLFYFYNRQLRIVIKEYKELIKLMMVKNIKIKKIKKDTIYVLKRKVKIRQ